ncbi:MAG: DMT family transporter [Chloroflexota bacterium]
MHTKALPYIGLLSLFWGTNIVVSRFGVGEVDPYLFIALRLSVATFFFCLLFLYQLYRRAQVWPKDWNLWRHAGVSGVIGVAIPMSLFILSLQYQSSGVASIFVTIGPALMVIAAHFFLPDEKMSLNKVLGVALALVGSLLLVLRGENGLADSGLVGGQGASAVGFTFVLIALCSEVINTIFVRRRMTEMDPFVVTGIRLLVGAVITSIGAFFLAGNVSWTSFTPASIFSIVYAGVIGALAGQFMAFIIIRRFGATLFSLTTYLIPIVATTFGVLFLGEIVTLGMLIGMLLVGSGIYLINRPISPGARMVEDQIR